MNTDPNFTGKIPPPPPPPSQTKLRKGETARQPPPSKLDTAIDSIAKKVRQAVSLFNNEDINEEQYRENVSDAKKNLHKIKEVISSKTEKINRNPKSELKNKMSKTLKTIDRINTIIETPEPGIQIPFNREILIKADAMKLKQIAKQIEQSTTKDDLYTMRPFVASQNPVVKIGGVQFLRKEILEQALLQHPSKVKFPPNIFYNKDEILSRLRVEVQNGYKNPIHKGKNAEALEKADLKAINKLQENSSSYLTNQQLMTMGIEINLKRLSSFHLIPYVSSTDFIMAQSDKSKAEKLIKIAAKMTGEYEPEFVFKAAGTENTREILAGKLVSSLGLSQSLVPKQEIEIKGGKIKKPNNPIPVALNPTGIASRFLEESSEYPDEEWMDLMRAKKDLAIAEFHMSQLPAVRDMVTEYKILQGQQYRRKLRIKALKTQESALTAEINKLRSNPIKEFLFRKKIASLEKKGRALLNEYFTVSFNLRTIEDKIKESNFPKNILTMEKTIEEYFEEATTEYTGAKIELLEAEFRSSLPPRPIEDDKKTDKTKLTKAEEYDQEVKVLRKNWKGAPSIRVQALTSQIFCDYDAHLDQYMLVSGDTKNIDMARFMAPSEAYILGGEPFLAFRSQLFDHPALEEAYSQEEINIILSWDIDKITNQWKADKLVGDPEQFKEAEKQLNDISKDLSKFVRFNKKTGSELCTKYNLPQDTKEEDLKAKIMERELEIKKQCFSVVHPRALKETTKRLEALQSYCQKCAEDHIPAQPKKAFELMYPLAAPFMKVLERLEDNPGNSIAMHYVQNVQVPRTLSSIIQQAKKENLATQDEIEAMEQALTIYKKDAPHGATLGTTMY